MLWLSLRAHGWHTELIWDADEGEAIRRRVFNFLGRLMGQPDLRGMPHGRNSSALWNFFPENFRIERADFRVTPGDIIVSQNARESCLRVEGLDEGWTLPMSDLFIVGAQGIFATDHEEEGPWFIHWDAQPFSADIKNPKDLPTPLAFKPAHIFEYSEREEAEAWIRENLEERSIYVPDYPLPATGIGEDHLWNYMPRAFEIHRQRGTLVGSLLQASDVMAWTDDEPGAILVRRPSLTACLTHRNAYFLEWPEKRWVLAVAELCAGNLDDTDLLPCFVPLR